MEVGSGLAYSSGRYHRDCLKEYLMTKKRGAMTEEEAEEKVKEIEGKKAEKQKGMDDRNELFNFLMKRYNVRYFPQFFYVKVGKINKGTYQKFKGSVSCGELLEIYKKLATRLSKACESKRIKQNDRFHYELAIVLSNVNKYRDWKEKKRINEQAKKEVVVEAPTVVKTATKKSKLKRKEILF